MKADELKKGKKLADESLAWHRSTMPFPDEYVEEAIPQLVKWLKQHAFPELERTDESVTFKDVRSEIRTGNFARRKK